LAVAGAVLAGAVRKQLMFLPLLKVGAVAAVAAVDPAFQVLLAAEAGVLAHRLADLLNPVIREQHLAAVRAVLALRHLIQVFVVEPGVLVVLGAVRVAQAVMELRRVSHLLKELLPALVALRALQLQAIPTLHGLHLEFVLGQSHK
jgi:hypothetical protein